MKRVISIFLTLVLLIGCMSISVFANGLSEFSNDSLVNVMDYIDFPQWYFTPSLSEETIYIDFPEDRVFYGFDFVFLDNSAVSAVYFNHPSLGRVPMSLIDIGHQLKRCFVDNVMWTGSGGSFTFVYGHSNPSYWIQINSFYINYSNVSHFTAPVVASGFTPSSSIDLSLNTGDSRPTQATWSATDFNNLPFSIDISCPDWKKYDFIDFQFICTVKSITSVSVSFGDFLVPFSFSEVYIDGSSSISIITSLRIDLRGLDRNSTSTPTIVLTGNSNFESLNAFKLADCSGYLYLNKVNPLFYYFKDLKTKLEVLFYDLGNSISSSFNPDDSGSSSQFQESLSNQSDQLSNISDSMDSVLKPDLNSFNIDLDSFASNANISGVGSVLAVPMKNELLLQVLIMTFTFALVGYALFGKR